MSFPIKNGDFPWFVVCLPGRVMAIKMATSWIFGYHMWSISGIQTQLAMSRLIAVIFQSGGSWRIYISKVPSGKLTNDGKSPFFNGNTHYKWQFSIAMLNYQRVSGEYNMSESTSYALKISQNTDFIPAKTASTRRTGWSSHSIPQLSPGWPVWVSPGLNDFRFQTQTKPGLVLFMFSYV